MRFRTALLALLATLPLMVFAEQPTFRKKFNVAAKEMVPVLQTTNCTTKPVKKVPGKAITECELQMPNSLLTFDSMNGQLAGVWLMMDSSKLDHPSDIMRTGGMLLRAARGASYGDYLAVAAKALDMSRQQGGKEVCLNDKESAARFCVSSNDRGIFDMTLQSTGN